MSLVRSHEMKEVADHRLRVSLIQTDIAWEEKERNLLSFTTKIRSLKGTTDLVVLPEMCTTGFSMQSRQLAEPPDGKSLTAFRALAMENDLTIVGSLIVKEKEEYFNRGFFFLPDGTSYSYDKRHLFRMGEEDRHFSAGNKRLIVRYKEWNICLMICYDLRFPVWCRNQKNEYDLLLFVASWPESRIKVWDTLLVARALENLSYVVGVNQVGRDGYNLNYCGKSALIDPKGKTLLACPDGTEQIATCALSLEALQQFRAKFPAGEDADSFVIL
jgi:omega-amidase